MTKPLKELGKQVIVDTLGKQLTNLLREKQIAEQEFLDNGGTVEELRNLNKKQD